jgi:hypothetical protein
LRQTSAARTSRFALKPYAIADALLMEHGITSIPSVLNEPDEIDAPRSPSR